MSSIFLRYFVCRPRVEFKASFDLQTMLPWGEPRRLQVVAGRGFEEQGQILVRSVAWCTLWVFFQCSLKLIEIAVPTWWNVVGKFQETLQFCGGLFVDRLQVLPLYYPVRMRSALKLLPCRCLVQLCCCLAYKNWESLIEFTAMTAVSLKGEQPTRYYQWRFFNRYPRLSETECLQAMVDPWPLCNHKLSNPSESMQALTTLDETWQQIVFQLACSEFGLLVNPLLTSVHP